jgi:hypothetical protein
MTQDLVRIFNVSSQETTTPGLRLYVITATKVTRPDMGLQLETVNDYAASICQRAKDLNRSVVVSWAKTRYGRTLMAAHLLKPKEA